MEDTKVDLVGMKTIVDFKVMEIMDEKDPYPTLLGIKWAYYNDFVINKKQRKVSLKTKET